MGPALPQQFSNEFDLDTSILGVGSATKINLSAATAPDVLTAILANTAFPIRPNGQIELGSIALHADAGKSVTFDAGQAKVGFTAAAGGGTGIGVFDRSSDAVQSLKLPGAPGLDLSIPGAPATRYLVMSWQYNLSGTISAAHPIGAIGSASATFRGNRNGVYAVLHAFPAATGARTAIADTVSSWRLPRHVGEESDLRLKPRTWLVAEVDASLALGLSAQVGYNFTLLHELKVLGLTRDISAKIDAGLKATFGFSVDDTYLVVLGRESDDAASGDVRLRLFKQSGRQLDFGVNLTVGVQGKADLPATIHDVVKAVFDVHGTQVVKDLQILEKWTDPNADLGANIAGLVNSTGLELLTKVAGIDAAAEFNKARAVVLDALAKWNSLPSQLSATLWKLLGTLDPAGAADFKKTLTLLSDPNPANLQANLSQLIGNAVFGDSPAAKWLTAIADQGLVSLSSELDRVQKLAAGTLALLNGGVIAKLQAFIDEKLNLATVMNVVSQNDFNKVDAWLVNRLSNFLNEKLDFAKVKPLQKAIQAVLTKSEEIYEKAVAALNGKYNFQFAATYSAATSDTALLDVVFDVNQPGVRGMLRSVLTDGNLNDLLLRPVPGVTLNQAALTHGITQTGTAQVHLPMVDFTSTHVMDSLAKLTVKDEGGRVFLYELDASDTVTVKVRYQSQLSALASLRVVDGTLRIGPGDENSIRYTDRQVRKNITFQQIRERTEVFAHNYLTSVVGPDEASRDEFYQRLEAEVGQVRGDGVLSMEVSYPGQILDSWFVQRNPESLKAKTFDLSLTLQAALRDHLFSYYFRDVDRLKNLGAAAPLLVWASLPLSASVSTSGGQLRFNTNQSAFWNFPDASLRKAMVDDSHTATNLQGRLAAAQNALLAAGEPNTAKFYAADQVNSMRQLAVNPFGDNLLNSLLFVEAEMIGGAVKALGGLQSTLAALNTDPALAVQRFSEFGADLTKTFHAKLTSVYGDDSLRTLGPVLLIAAAKGLDQGAATVTPDALSSFAILAAGHTFVLADFLAGNKPDPKEIAFSKTIVTAAPQTAGAARSGTP